MIRPLFLQAIDSLRNQKLSRDIAYTLGSFFVLAISGIVINVAITALRDAAALGVFNLAYAVYIVASQFAVWGMHYSVLRHAAYYESDPVERGRMLATAGACAIGMGIVAAVVLVIAEPLFARLFSSADTGLAVRNAALGLALFPLNKVLLAYLNGLRRMKAFSLLQGIRYFIVMLSVSSVAASALPIEYTTYCFLGAEVITALLAVGYMVNRKLVGHLNFTAQWVSLHYRFGTKGLMSGMFAEVNSRVDVLMIGFFLSDRATGIYSFAAMLVDGLYHILAMVRINFNPLLVSAIRDQDWSLAQSLRRNSKRFLLPVICFLAGVLIVAFYVFSTWFVPAEKGILEGMPSLVILLGGLILVSFLVPFDNLMMVSGHPGFQTIQQIVTVTANVVLAVLLLPVLGIEGAAIGTAASYVTGIAMLSWFAWHVLGWNLLTNKVKV